MARRARKAGGKGRTGAERRDSKIAVVCGGGGITGGVFEVGSLRALDLALGGDVLQTFDLYAGASAGALVASLLAAGVTPSDMEEVLVRGGRNRRKLPALKRSSIYGVEPGVWALAAMRFPLYMAGGMARSLLPGESRRPADAFLDSLGNMPPGLFTNAPLEQYLSAVFRRLGCEPTFDGLDKELYVTAVNVDNGTRAVFGEQGARSISVPRAVRASAALPILFRPVRIGEQEFIDGGIAQNLPVDIAVRHGASLIIAINPLVPVVNDPRDRGRFSPGRRYLSDRGLPTVVDQVFRMLIRSQVLYGLQATRDQYPEVDIVFFEPEAHDFRMFRYHPMRYGARQILATHAFGQCRDRLIRDGEELSAVFARHGLDFDPGRLRRRKRRRSRVAGERLLQALGTLPGLRRFVSAEGVPEPF